MNFYLLSFHGTLLSRVPGRSEVTQVPLGPGLDRNDLLRVALDPDRFRQPYADFIEQKPVAAEAADIRHLGACDIHPFPDTRTVALARDGFYAGLPPQGLLEINRSAVQDWERFLPCSDADLDFLLALSKDRWIIKSTRALVEPGAIGLGQAFSLNIGPLSIPLNYNLPFEQKHAPFRFTVLSEGWKINEILLFRPLIYYLAFGEDNVFQQLSYSLISLSLAAQYRGKVWVYSDKDAGEIHRAMHWMAPDQLTAKPLIASDWVGFVAGKYCILEDEAADAYQPVVYMDPDIIYNADIQPMLIAMAVSEKMTAPLESFSGLEHAPSVGAALLQHDHEHPGFASGFNCGTIGIPNLPSQRHHLRLIRRLICNILGQRGRSALHWVDQEVANYVSYKMAHFETHEISTYVRYGFEGPPPVPTEPLSGLVHFWGIARPGRPQVMRDYLDRVLKRQEAARNDAKS